MKIELKDELYTVISDFYYKERLLLTQFKTLDEFLEFCTKQGFVKAMETVDLTKAGLYIRMARPEILAKRTDPQRAGPAAEKMILARSVASMTAFG